MGLPVAGVRDYVATVEGTNGDSPYKIGIRYVSTDELQQQLTVPDGRSFTTKIQVTGDGLVQKETTSQGTPHPMTQTFSPPQLFLRRQLARGQTWSTSTTLRSSGPERPVKQVYTVTAVVATSVGGKPDFLVTVHEEKTEGTQGKPQAFIDHTYLASSSLLIRETQWGGGQVIHRRIVNDPTR